MNGLNTDCPKCGGSMEEGFIADHTYGGTLTSDWVEGAPVKSFWTGTKISDKQKYRVKTLRCAGCGFLESYATEESSNSSLF